ncbi:gastrula zinc finger protein XlCGF57.1-like [Phlebotomus argentipes]|uniref:gastrula zinc finger protein XlCGF57.1-like n=1 Tax=Phlebotomus argentipes TaxID=94469 RepID=UPI002892ABDF|nr:gastrula zinc finger protein XlCGF57.1-like [Phlebotomus argentipes]
MAEESKGRYPCTICGKFFKTPPCLKAHVKRHSDERKFQCAICRKDFRDKTSVRRHVLEVHEGKKPSELSTISYKCAECEKMFWNKTKYERHLLMHSDVRNEECPVCCKKFKHKFYLERHMLVHNTAKPYSCKICGKSFGREYYLKKHLMRHRDKTLKCAYCTRTYRNDDGFRSHMDMFHRGLPDDPGCDVISCTICSEVFEDFENLKSHVQIHPLEKPFECAECGKTYINKRRVRDHITFAHVGEKKIYKRTRKSPQKTARHGVKKVETVPKCTICLKVFKGRKFLKNHMILHDKDRPLFPCKICGLQLKRKSTLRDHEKNHEKSKEITYINCPGCWKTYIKKRSFNKHMERHHKDLLKKLDCPDDEEVLESVIECSETIKTEPDWSYELINSEEDV